MFPSFSVFPVLLVTVGAVVFFVAFLGCCGALTANLCKLISYIVILLVMLVLQITLVAYILIMTNYNNVEDEKRFKKFIYTKLLTLFLKYNSNILARQLIDIIQHRYYCCGIGTPCDWVLLNNGTGVPLTCCPPFFYHNCSQQMAYGRGCLLPLYNMIRDNAVYFSTALMIVTAMEIGASVVAICLANMIRVDMLVYVYPDELPATEADERLDMSQRGELLRGTAIW
ncbi:hypothetical protein ILUMI_06994 [Ignelater luminosus]|uniref:Tetraspanin n=1 Tax=Ignelater luminosus TaxID=2038154 RepID=A0A8K0D958_IGNLU|nr:hypothetical protein ILUMI_06994 [Ignelater luminosus]